MIINEEKKALKLEKSLSHDLCMTVTNYAKYYDGFSFCVSTELEAYKAVYKYRYCKDTHVSQAPNISKWCVKIYQDAI